MEILNIVYFENIQRIPITTPDGGQQFVDSFIAPTTNFIIPYKPWPIKIIILIIVRGIEKEEFHASIKFKETGEKLFEAQGDISAQSTGIIPQKNSTANIILNMDNLTIKKPGEYLFNFRIGTTSQQKNFFVHYQEQQE